MASGVGIATLDGTGAGATGMVTTGAGLAVTPATTAVARRTTWEKNILLTDDESERCKMGWAIEWAEREIVG